MSRLFLSTYKNLIHFRSKVSPPRYLLVFLALILTLFISMLVFSANFEHGLDALKKGDYATWLMQLTPLGEREDVNAQHLFGVIYANGRGVTQDNKTAIKWWTLAADQGHAASQHNLGLMYDYGQGVPQDYKVAIKWYRLAAEQGYTKSQFNLGIIYTREEGVSQDLVRAHMWLSIAARKDDKAELAMDVVARSMTTLQLAEARELARKWIEDHPTTGCELIPCEDDDYTLGLKSAGEETAAVWAYIENTPYDEVIKKRGDLWIWLRQKKFELLDAYLEKMQSMYEKNEIDEYVYKRSMYEASWSNSWNLPSLDAWIAATGSAFAYQSKGHTLISIAWEARGTARASKTSPKDLVVFKTYLSRSEVELSKALELNPKLVTSYTGLFKVVRGHSDYDDAFPGWLESMEKYVPQAYYPRVEILQMLEPRWGGSYKQMREFSLRAQKYVHLNPRLRALFGFEWADRAARLRKKGRTQEAVEAYSKAIYHGAMANWLLARAKLYRKQKDWGNMKADVELVLTIFPKSYKALRYKGIALWSLGKHEKANRAFSKTVEIWPYGDSAWYMWGRHLMSQKRFAEAKEKLERARTIDPTVPEYFYWYAWALMNAGDIKTINAFEDYLQMCDAKESKCLAEDLEWADKWLECIYNNGNCELDAHFYHGILPKYNRIKSAKIII